MTDLLCHNSCILVKAPVDAAFDIMADGLRQGEWASSRKSRVGNDLFVGISALDGKETFVRIHSDHHARIADYETGRAGEQLRFRNSGCVIAGSTLGYPHDSSLVTLTAWRLKSAPEHAWKRTCFTHEAEIYRIKDLLERGVSGQKRLVAPLPRDTCHMTSIVMDNSPEDAFAFVSNPANQGLWAWGEAARSLQPGGACCRSVFDGRNYSVRLRVDAKRMVVDCAVGADGADPVFRYTFRVVAGQLLDHDAGAVITLTTWRHASEGSFDWTKSRAHQEAELLLVKERLAGG